LLLVVGTNNPFQEIFATIELNVLICCVISHFLIANEDGSLLNNMKKRTNKNTTTYKTNETKQRIVPKVASFLIDYVIDAFQGKVILTKISHTHTTKDNIILNLQLLIMVFCG
jgi:uncharacterized protein YpmS